MTQIYNYARSKLNTLDELSEVLPISIPAGLAVFTIVSTLLLVLNSLGTIVVLLTALPASLLTLVYVHRAYPLNKSRNKKNPDIINLCAVVFVALWILCNILYTSQHVFTNRDPATYAVSAAWLVKHDNLKIKTPELFRGIEGITGESAGFLTSVNDINSIESQGAHALPALLGLAGRIVGPIRLLRLPPLIGGLALYAFFGFARLVVKPRWALIASILLGFTLPMIYFTRDVYTEPLTILFLFGGLNLLIAAFRSNNHKLGVASGFVLGAASLTRIDSWLPLVGVFAFYGIILIMTPTRSKIFQRYLRMALSTLIPLGIVGFVGWADLTLLSSNYYNGQRSLFLAQIAVIVLIIALLVLGIWIRDQTGMLKRISRGVKKDSIYKTGAYVVMMMFLLLLGRPLFSVGRSSLWVDTTTPIQMNTGLKVEPRDYTELSMSWLTWYLGYTLVVLSIVGISLMLYQLREKKNSKYLPLLLVVVPATMVYLVRPSITPDQIWAMRRFLPISFPGMILFAVFAVEHFSTKYLKKVSHEKFVIVSFMILLLPPIFSVSRPYLTTRNSVQASAIQSVCSAVPKNSAVLWLGLARLEQTQPTRAYCSLPSAGYSKKILNPTNKLLPTDDHISTATLSEFSKSARRDGKMPILGVYESQKDLLPYKDRKPLSVVSTVSWSEVQQTLVSAPVGFETRSSVIMMGIVGESGEVNRLRR